MSHMEWPCEIGADEFQAYSRGLTFGALSVVSFFPVNCVQDLRSDSWGEEEIDKIWTRNLNICHDLRHTIDDQACQLLRTQATRAS